MKFNKIALLIVGLVCGLFWAAFLLYSRRGGHLIINDYISLTLVTGFVIGIFFYFRNKWKKVK